MLITCATPCQSHAPLIVLLSTRHRSPVDSPSNSCRSFGPPPNIHSYTSNQATACSTTRGIWRNVAKLLCTTWLACATHRPPIDPTSLSCRSPAIYVDHLRDPSLSFRPDIEYFRCVKTTVDNHFLYPERVPHPHLASCTCPKVVISRSPLFGSHVCHRDPTISDPS